MRTTPLRSGFTLLELVVVLAILIVLTAVTLPSFTGMKSNADQKEASDQFRSRVADARGLAMQESVPYRLAINADGTRIRVAPDTSEFADAACSVDGHAGAKAIETTLAKATVSLEASAENEDDGSSEREDSWITVATFLPNGTCREAQSIIAVSETGFPPIRILIRGLTGTSSVMANDASASTSASTGGMK